MKIIKTAMLTQAATTTTKYESPKPKAKFTQAPDVPQQRSSGDERPEDGQLPEARLNRQRRNWREAAMADVPVVIARHVVTFRTKA